MTAPWYGAYQSLFSNLPRFECHGSSVDTLLGVRVFRKGDFSPIAASLAYLYLYELLNGIGTSSPEDGSLKDAGIRNWFPGFRDWRFWCIQESAPLDAGIRGDP